MLSLSPDGRYLLLPALDHRAFARVPARDAGRGAASAAACGAPTAADDFWSWRGAMYRAARARSRVDRARQPRRVPRAPRRPACAPSASSTTSTTSPTARRTTSAPSMSDAVVARRAKPRASASRSSASRITAPARVAPRSRSSAGSATPTVDDVLRDVDALRAKYKDDPDVRVGLAPHSVRAVPPQWIAELGAYAARHALPFHMHVAEQPPRDRRVRRRDGQAARRAARRPRRALESRSSRCMPRTSRRTRRSCSAPRERSRASARRPRRDLGDGLPDLGALRAAGARLCTGHRQPRHHRPDRRSARARDARAPAHRHSASRSSRRRAGTPAEELWRAGSIEGALACGFADAGGTLRIRRDHPGARARPAKRPSSTRSSSEAAARWSRASSKAEPQRIAHAGVVLLEREEIELAETFATPAFDVAQDGAMHGELEADLVLERRVQAAVLEREGEREVGRRSRARAACRVCRRSSGVAKAPVVNASRSTSRASPRALAERQHAGERDEVMRADAVEHDLERLALADAAGMDQLLAEHREIGRTRSTDGDRSAHERDAARRCRAGRTEPLTGASTKRAPCFSARWPAATAALRPMVDMSTSTGRGLRCSRANVGEHAVASFEDRGERLGVAEHRDDDVGAVARSRAGVGQAVAPSFASAFSGPRVRLYTRTAKPASTRRAAMGRPMPPSPTNATVCFARASGRRRRHAGRDRDA